MALYVGGITHLDWLPQDCGEAELCGVRDRVVAAHLDE